MFDLRSSYGKELPSSITSELETVNSLVQNYTFLTSNKLLKSPKSVNSDIYFDKGTKLISAIIKAYNSCNRAILEDSKGWI